MTEERRIAIVPTAGGGLATWAEMREQAAVLVKSGFLPKHVKTPEQALAIMLTGRELGVPAMAAIRGMFVLDGAAVANTQLMLALVRRSGQMELFDPKDGADHCTVTVKRRGEPAVTITWSDVDTQNAGLAGKQNWRQYPRVMRRWRAVSEALRLAFTDILNGIYTPEELGVGYRVEGDNLVLDVGATATDPDPARSRPGFSMAPPADVIEPEKDEPASASAAPWEESVPGELERSPAAVAAEFEEELCLERRKEIKTINDAHRWNWNDFLIRFRKLYKQDFEEAGLTQLDDALDRIKKANGTAGAPA